MNRVKLFESTSIRLLEEDINKFLETKDDSQIQSVKITGEKERIVAMIVWRE
jgi:hypothetical protein